jgi:hypothetical protein
MMLRIAADYDRLAKHADGRSSDNSMMLRTAADYEGLARRAAAFRGGYHPGEEKV